MIKAYWLNAAIKPLSDVFGWQVGAAITKVVERIGQAGQGLMLIYLRNLP